MTAFALALRFRVAAHTGRSRPLLIRGTAVFLLALAAIVVPDGLEISGQAITDAYLAVSVFVAATLVVLYATEGFLRTDLGAALTRYHRWQVPAGALLGALPGCGGAIVAVTQFTRGRLSFGALVATLTSTMGDAIFLLLAREPGTAGIVIAVSTSAGILTGYLVDATHGRRFMQAGGTNCSPSRRPTWFGSSMTMTEKLWIVLLPPGLALGVLAAMQVEMESASVSTIGLVGGLLALVMWVTHGGDNRDCRTDTCDMRPQSRRVIDDTNFVTAWVTFAFVGYELFVVATGVDLGSVFTVWATAVPAIAVAVGFIPGCGPQIVTTSLYLDRVIPLSAQLGNAISNDGDALFPAIAKAPKAAAAATLYSTLPALIVAYGAFALGW